MPRPITGSTYQTKTEGVGIRWPEDGREQRRTGFRNKTEARDWFNENVGPRLRRTNPAVEAGPNHQPRAEEIRPFTRAELDAIVEEFADSPRDAGIVIFAAQTGLRTSEWPALERRDIDWRNPAVAVQRRYINRTLTPYPNTEASRRRVPLTPAAMDALGPRRIDTVLFPTRVIAGATEQKGRHLQGEHGKCGRPCGPPALVSDLSRPIPGARSGGAASGRCRPGR